MERVMTEEYISPEDSPVVRLSVEELRDRLDYILTRVANGEERAIVSRDGKDVAAVISIEEFWFLERAIAQLEDYIDIEEAEKILAQTKPEDYIPYDRVRKELGLK